MTSTLDRDDSSSIIKLELACSDLKTLLKNSAKMEASLGDMDRKFERIHEALAAASKRVAPLQSSSIAARALEARINRAVTPALSLLDAFKLSDSLQLRLLRLHEELAEEGLAAKPSKRLSKMAKYVDCVDKLNAAIGVVGGEGEQVIQRLQEVVEFLSRTKAADTDRTQRLRETVLTLKALYETEVDSMRFEGSLDEALLNLQDEFERLLQQIRHSNLEAQNGNVETDELGTELEVRVLRRIADTLATNDCLDICIDIFVKVRYRRVAKALMRLNPDYLRTYTPEEIDEMDWESLETAIALWIKHFELAVSGVLVAEKILCERVLGGVMDGLVWPECFAKIADKIMAVFFRFGEGVARSSKEPQKLFKLLDMFASLQSLAPRFSDVFGGGDDGDSGSDIRSRFRELVKLLVHASSKVYWEFGLQIEGNSDGFPPPQDGSVPKLVRYAINYLKYLATEDYRSPMTKVLQTERIWKSNALYEPDSDEDLFGEAITNVMEALQRNVESKRCRYRDRKILSNVFAMNTYWYIYMRTKNTELAKVLGDQYMKRRYKAIAEESAYLYQKQAWGDLVALLEKEDLEGLNGKKEESLRLKREKAEAFANGFEEVLRGHRGAYCIPDGDLRGQIREATVKLVVSSYSEFVGPFKTMLKGRSFLTPEAIEVRLGKFFDGVGGKIGRREFNRDRTVQKISTSAENEIRDFRRSGSNTSD